jgi:hypothetical protein
MAWSAQKNQIFFERARNWAAAVKNLLEERDRLIDLYNNEAHKGGTDDAAFVDTAIATKTELVALATNVMTPFSNMVNNVAVTTAARMQYLTPFLADQT